VDAEGKVLAKPDLATLYLEVETQAPQAEAAAQENARRAEGLLAALKKMLGPEEKVQSLSFRLTPVRTQKDRSRPAEITAYQAIHRFQAQIRDLGRLGAVLDAAMNNGASRVQGPYWGHSRQDELQQQATLAALARARRLAEALAQAVGLKIKGLHKLSTVYHFKPPRPLGDTMVAAAAPRETPIEVGEEEIKAQVQAVFELTP
jgi:uncharacterized protein YggE